MRAFGCFLLGVVAAILVIAFGLFAVENGQMVSFSFLGSTARMSLWLLVGIPAVIGFVLALLLVTPARAASDRHRSALQGQHRALERDVAEERQRNEQLRSEHDRLRASYQQVVAERDNLNTRLTTVQQAAALPAHETSAATVPAGETAAETEPVHEPVTRDAAVYHETPRTVQREEPVAPVTQERVPEQQPVAMDETAHAEPAAQPTLGERLRGMFNGQRTTEEEEADRLNSRGPAPSM